MKLNLTGLHVINKIKASVTLLIFCLFTLGSSTAVKAAVILNVPPKTVTGTVNDKNGAPLPGVSVKVKGQNIGASTDRNGKFTINVPEENSVIVFSFVGFNTQEVVIANRTVVNVTLTEDISSLNEVVVTGYTTQSRNTITTSVSKLDNRILENVPYQNVATALQGALPGVRVQSTTGQPGASPRVLVRGGDFYQ